MEAGRANQRIPDNQVLAFAVEERRALLTLNRLDFFRLHQAALGRHFGIIACARDDTNLMALAQRIHDAVTRTEQLEGQCLRIVRPYA